MQPGSQGNPHDTTTTMFRSQLGPFQGPGCNPVNNVGKSRRHEDTADVRELVEVTAWLHQETSAY